MNADERRFFWEFFICVYLRSSAVGNLYELWQAAQQV
jgi:hypothetical protein